MTRREGHGRTARQQGAIPLRHGLDGIEVLLVTSRGSGRWIIPKGWPVPNMSSAESAAREAFEEAGVRGVMTGGGPLGAYVTNKRADVGAPGMQIDVFVLEVTSVLDDWPEARERQRAWFKPGAAAQIVEEPELARMIEEAATAFGTRADGGDAASQS